jgi:hypothetical protein
MTLISVRLVVRGDDGDGVPMSGDRTVDHSKSIDEVLRFLQAYACHFAVALDGLNPLPGNKQIDDACGNVVTGVR